MTKHFLHIASLLGLAVLAACTPSVKVPEHIEGPTSELQAIDSLMWHQPDSALAMVLDYFDGRDGACSVSTAETFNNHYAHLLLAELLYKNDYGQSNRAELQQAVNYFDSLTAGIRGADTRKADTRGVSLQPDPCRDASHASAKRAQFAPITFLSARAHYINGVGYYERDSLIEACGEYLNALRMMEGHFEEKELVGHKARFMSLTYNRLLDVFRYQLMPEPAIVCAKQSLAYNKIAPTSKYGESILYSKIGLQYDVLEEPDSAAYYHNKALEVLPDRNTLAYRDMVSSWAFFQHNSLGHTQIALDSLKSLVAKATDDNERITRYMSIGMVYVDIGQFDSAKLYLEPVFEKDPDRAIVVAKPLKDIALSEGDTLKANEYALPLAEVGASAADNQFLVSKLNDQFHGYLQEKQETALALERLEARRRNLWRGGGVALLAIVGLAVAIVTRRSHRKRLAAQEAEAQRRLDEALQRHDAVERELQTKVDDALQQARAMLPQRVNDLYRSKLPNRLERIMAEFEAAYPRAMERLATAYPELNETERQIAMLNFLRFRSKEEADLTGFTENTTLKYRSNLNKKAGSDPISLLFSEGKI